MFLLVIVIVAVTASPATTPSGVASIVALPSYALVVVAPVSSFFAIAKSKVCVAAFHSAVSFTLTFTVYSPAFFGASAVYVSSAAPVTLNITVTAPSPLNENLSVVSTTFPS